MSVCFGFLNSLTLSAYLNVFKVCSEHDKQGLILAIIKVRQFPIKESLNTKVNLLPLKGLCLFSISKARIHSFNANNDLLISAPSIFVFLFVSIVSTALSLPAKSIKEILENFSPSFVFIAICRIAWDLDESKFAPVIPTVLEANP